MSEQRRDPTERTKLVVPIVVGTRPEAIKLVPIIIALRQSELYEPVVVSTGQHNRLVEYIFELADIKPDVTLWAGSRRANLNERVASVMQRFEDFCVERFDVDPDAVPTSEDVLSGRHPAAVLVHGDTSSAMAAALSAFHLHIPVMHVEAGLRTGHGNLTPFPEELNRQVISTIAALHFAPTSANLQNLVRENIPVDQVFVTGNTGIDALQWASGMDVEFANPELQRLHDSDARIVVVTAHRRENWGDGLRGIAAGVGRLADTHRDTHFVLPVHPNPRVREVLTESLTGYDNVLLTEPLGYATFARLLGRCHLVITDSGGIQEEAPSLGKPVLVTRETTERTEGLAAGTLKLVGNDPERIFAVGTRLLESDAAYAEMASAQNPYGDGRAAERIVGSLEHLLLGEEPPTPFGPGYSRAAVTVAAGYEPMPGSAFELLEAAVDGSAPDSESLRVAAPAPDAVAEPSLAEESIVLAED
ncbi:MAG TPA: UDP-N-acetylglucosamine 2-epimerase (non-hydrolyzing) [Solirubrobacterales bacterium]|nr:UDP-N-acetylglucosamine 2-epimerase (non-hydrolyzing) [Solirubrobacterales bacterium]